LKTIQDRINCHKRAERRLSITNSHVHWKWQCFANTR